MNEQRFKVVFDKLSEASTAEDGNPTLTIEVESMAEELDELNELRRLSQVLSEPPSGSFTST